ncbi:MAG: glycosyltransferase family 39 protein, partial [Anaerolineales bacterium]|nr:glycosyltransferase family 39 protein [Anaerolineales bacterium]
VANGPIEAKLPGALPFTIAELEREIEQAKPELELEAAVVESSLTVEQRQVRPMIGPRLVKGGLTLLALLFALLAQMGFVNNGVEPGAGLRSLVMSAFFLLLLWGYGRAANGSRNARAFSFPRLQAIPRQRLLYVPALFLSLIALTSSNAGRAWLALFLWFVAIALALFALWPVPKPAPSLDADNTPSAFIAGGLFVMALLLRTINLQNLPFILNGTEAGVGLEVLRVAQGGLAAPFGSSALGSPTLPLFLLALPLKWFGPSTVSIRLLSPLAGALTVTAVYWIGERLWGRAAGLAAAVLLLTGHLHLHYSRMGLTSIWDGLLALLALGLIGVAWQGQRDGRANGVTWLLAGTAVGLCAYFFIPALLLPIMLAALFLLLFWADRANLRAQWRQILATGALALVIALPQLLHNRSQPNSLWQQWQAASILNPSVDWLAQEAARTGQTESAMLRQQVWRGLLAFNGSADKSPSYRTQSALLSFVPGLLFLLGLLLALFRLRDVRALLLLVWVGVTLLFTAVLIPDAPQSHWLVIATPALALLGGFALVTLAQWQGMAPRTALVVALVIAALLAVGDGVYYYGRFPAENQFADRNTEVANDIANYLNTLGADWTAYFYGPPQMYVDFPNITFLAQDFHKNENLFDVSPAPDDALPPVSSARQVFVFLPERANEMTAVQSLYPGGEVRVFDGRYANPLFYSYEIGN